MLFRAGWPLLDSGQGRAGGEALVLQGMARLRRIRVLCYRSTSRESTPATASGIRRSEARAFNEHRRSMPVMSSVPSTGRTSAEWCPPLNRR